MPPSFGMRGSKAIARRVSLDDLGDVGELPVRAADHARALNGVNSHAKPAILLICFVIRDFQPTRHSITLECSGTPVQLAARLEQRRRTESSRVVPCPGASARSEAMELELELMYRGEKGSPRASAAATRRGASRGRRRGGREGYGG